MQKKDKKVVPMNPINEPMIVQMSRCLIVPDAPESLLQRLKGRGEKNPLQAPLKRMGMDYGTVGLYILDGDCMMWIEIERNYPDLKKHYPVLKRNMEDLSKYDITCVDLEIKPEFDAVKSLEDQYKFNEGLMELNKMIAELKNKGWDWRRIKRYVRNKHGINLTN